MLLHSRVTTRQYEKGTRRHLLSPPIFRQTMASLRALQCRCNYSFLLKRTLFLPRLQWYSTNVRHRLYHWFTFSPLRCLSTSTWTDTALNSIFSLRSFRTIATCESDHACILAHSPVQTLSLDITERASFISRLLNWCRRFWKSCQDFLFLFVRSTEVAVRFAPLLLLTPASILYSHFHLSDEEQKNWVADWTWWYIRSAITSLGPAFVKLGQWIATRRDMAPPHVCDRLSVLHDRGVLHHWNYTHRALVEAFGEDYVEQGLHLDQSSSIIGCGSAAQVYRGTLMRKENDSMVPFPVAVKVLHPRMGERVQRDLYFVQTIAHWLHALPVQRIQLLNLPRAVENFGAVLLRQADLQIEAKNLMQFRSNFYRNDTDEKESSILFPKPRPGWISKHVLVEDLVTDAIPIAEYLKDSTEQGIQIRKEIASPLLRAFLKMVFLDNFVHCDLHAGNVLIQTSTVDRRQSTNLWFSFLGGTGRNLTANQSTETKRKIVFLDAGIAMSLNPSDRRNLHDLFRAVILNEGNEAGRLMVERAQNERCSQIPGGVDAFAAGIEDLVSEFHVRRKEGLTLGTVRIGSLLSRVLDLCRVYGVEIDPNMSGIVISTLVLEGLGRSLEPELNLIDFAVPFVLGRGTV
jgi:aarF domain-containing kinase